MITLADFITRLQANCPTLKNVKGSASLASAQTASMQMPCAFVIYHAENAQPNNMIGIHSQQVNLQIGVYIAVKNVTDGRGEKAGEDFESVKTEVLNALIGWQPIDAANLVDYVSGKNYGFDNMTLYWYGVFSTDYHLRK